MGRLQKLLVDQGMKLLGDPRFAKLASDPRVGRALMAALAAPGKVQHLTKDAVEKLARSMNLATEEEVTELKRQLRHLEEELARLQRRP